MDSLGRLNNADKSTYPSQANRITLALEFHVQRGDSRTYKTSLTAKKRTDVLQDVIGIQPRRPACDCNSRYIKAARTILGRGYAVDSNPIPSRHPRTGTRNPVIYT